MPSGAKKRKAAKKKKETQSNDHSNPSSASTHSHGDEDVKHLEDKESDTSPASQDHHSHRNLLTEGEDEEIEKKGSLTNPPVQELKIDSDEKHTVVKENVVGVEKEFKIEGESDKSHGSVEQDEARGKHTGSSGSSSGESLDDESRVIKNSRAAGDIAPVVDSVMISDSLPGKSSEAVHSAPIKEAGNLVEKALLSVNQYEAKKPSLAEDKVGPSMTSALEREEKQIVQSIESTDTYPDKSITQENHDKLTLPHNAPRPTGAEHENSSGVTEPLLVPSQAPVQRTSWKSCCGLFEVFSGSST